MCRITMALAVMLLLAGTLVVTLGASSQDEAKRLARGAFYGIEEDPYDSEKVEKAIADIRRAQSSNPKEPWVAIATSRALLEMGYRKGNRYSISSYAPEAVEKAEFYAKQAVSLGSGESVAYAQLARLQLILENYRGAWDTLNQAHAHSTEDFYPWYLRGVLSVKMKDALRAKQALDEAAQRATLPYQHRFVIQERMNVARLTGDKDAEERYYKEATELDAQDAHAYGNYGDFLLGQKRYDEAIVAFEKAISISPYPLAQELLERAKLLRNAASR